MLMLLVASVGCNHSELKESNNIIAKVEGFQKSTGRLPNTLSEIGVKENESCPVLLQNEQGQLYGLVRNHLG